MAKGFSTFVTLIRFLLHVDFFMLNKVDVLPENFPTYIIDLRFLFSKNLWLLGKVCNISEVLSIFKVCFVRIHLLHVVVSLLQEFSAL